METNTNNQKKKISNSFFTGVIALVFLIIGYQTALFIQKAAVAHIVSNHDHPDTVFVYVGGSKEEKVAPVVKRIEAKHDARTIAVQQQFVRRQYQSFRFNPNTVSVADLKKLGFSEKQAQSIDHYRKKGGRFRRKEDFAKSFVVADSVYQRLEPYIDIPLLDINQADSAAFDALPGIGGYFAARMVSHRKALHGYSCKEQLLDIKYFDKEKLLGLEDLITVSAPEPYPLWQLPADSLYRHPYIRSAARSLVFYREHHPVSAWTLEGLCQATVISEEMKEKLEHCVILPAQE